MPIVPFENRRTNVAKSIALVLAIFCATAGVRAQDNYWRQQNLKNDADANARRRQQEIDDRKQQPNRYAEIGSWDNVGKNISNYFKEKEQAEKERVRSRIESQRVWLESERARKAEEDRVYYAEQNRRKNSPVVTQRYTDGSVYVGQMYKGNGKKNGKGTLTFKDGTVFEGYFIDDKVDAGKYTYKGGETWTVGFHNQNKTAWGTYKWKNGNTYSGEYLYDKNENAYVRTGKGKLTFADGTTQEGYYENGLISHYAKIIYNTDTEKGKKGDIYEGKIKNGVKHGRGRYTHASGKVDDGYWVNGNYHGENPPPGEPKSLFFDELANGRATEGYYRAELNTSDGKYIGWVTKNIRDGYGEITHPNGERYEGLWRNDQKFEGEAKSKGGILLYKGEFKNGVYHGWGETYKKKGAEVKQKGVFANGKYVGTVDKFIKKTGTSPLIEIKQGKYNEYKFLYEGEITRKRVPHGKGIKKVKDISEYEGDFVNGLEHGKGKQTLFEYGVYEGDFVNGKRHGKGTFTYYDGTIYEGEFANGYIEGQGVLKGKNGNVYVGGFEKSKKHGKGKFTMPDGTYYEGDFVDGTNEGIGVETWADGKMYTGEYKNGKMHGKGKMTYPNGKIEEGNWEEGKFKGE